MYNLNELGNFKKITDQRAILHYDIDIYAPGDINAVAQYMIGKCNTIVTKDDHDDKKILVELSIESGNIENIIKEFNEEVINYSFYNNTMESKKKIRETILERVLLVAKK